MPQADKGHLDSKSERLARDLSAWPESQSLVRSLAVKPRTALLWALGWQNPEAQKSQRYKWGCFSGTSRLHATKARLYNSGQKREEGHICVDRIRPSQSYGCGIEMWWFFCKNQLGETRWL